MAYLLDSNVFIEAHLRYYGMDLCPGFWTWLTDAHERGIVITLDKVRDELIHKGDELSEWIKKSPNHFFTDVDQGINPYLREVSVWAVTQDFQQAAVADFLSKADFFLIAHAKAHGHRIVTWEKHKASKSKIKIPTVCDALGMGKPLDTFEMLRNEKVTFHWLEQS
jgi:predicted nucleic acid-binding protein